MLFSAPGSSQERDRVGGDFGRADADGDGKLTREEWRRRGNFDRLDTDRDGALSLPEDTGLPIWTDTGYAHLDDMPDLELGQRVALGEIIGPTGNSGIGGKKREQSTRRRPAIHFSAFSAETGTYAIHRGVVIPAQGRWVDPIALYRGEMPLDSVAMKALPEIEKAVPIAVMFEDGEVFPAGTKFVWPYMCKRG